MNKPGLSKNVQEAKKRNNEIINNLKQTLGKPTIVEAQRTLKILEKVIDRIAIFLNLDSDFLVKFNEINNPQKLKLNKTLIQELSPGVLDLVVKEAKMEIEFKTHALIEQQEREGEIIEDEKKQEYLRIKKDMEYNFRSLVRALERHPQDMDILKSLKSNSAPNFEGASIYESLSNYKIIMQKMLATAAEEEDSHAQMIKELETKIDSLEKTKANCEGDLLKLRQERAKHTEDKKEEIDKLKSQIREVKNYKEKEIEKISKENKQLHDGLVKDHRSREDKLKAEINTEKGKLQKLRDENLKLENKSKGEKTTNEGQLIDLINTYDKEMFTLTNAKTDAQKELKRVSDELNNLKRHFAEIEEERKREEAIIEADRQRREKWELMERRKGEAATKIKEAYRLFKLKSKKKKKKKK
jgi:hypothetical protein